MVWSQRHQEVEQQSSHTTLHILLRYATQYKKVLAVIIVALCCEENKSPQNLWTITNIQKYLEYISAGTDYLYSGVV